MTGNTTLVEHGIQSEGSDLRAHVCPLERAVYVFPTQSGVDAVNSNEYPVVPAHQAGTDAATAEGCWVPPEAITRCVCISPRKCAWDAARFQQEDQLQLKGEKAAKFVASMIRQGIFPGSLGGVEVTDVELQIVGMDIIIHKAELPERRIQVKYDKGGRAGLFLQIRECNPLGLH